ncbi:MAG: UDP-N-acetylglucosamine 1-carboxyvinyltransferase [Clostridiales bacterium]|nr:UDP-N-acetylglucosamine 1-carboxyvinyltransferase [Clostridiales bacterium]
MEKFVINGGKRLSGTVKIESAKNSVLPLMAGAILTKDEVIIKNCPKIHDVLSMAKILRSLGVKVKFEEDNLVIKADDLSGYTVCQALGRELRASVVMMGALVSRLKKARLYYPGGCDIGLRPINMHLGALKSLGVSISETCGEIFCYTDRVKGREVYLDFPSVGATENAMLAAVLADGKTEIHNPAKEPEIVDLMKFLNSMGAKIYGAGTSLILVEGVKKLHGTEFTPSFDRIEAGTYLISAAITGGEVKITNCNVKNISSLVHKLCNNTCKISVKDDIIYLKSGRGRKSFSFSTGPYPSFPTDLQPQTMALACVSEGVSVIEENVFETRFKHVPELIKMGANITVKGRTAIVTGVPTLSGAEVYANDLRAGAALVLAGLCAEGTTVIGGIPFIERGYLDFDKKLRQLGADVKRQG